MGVVFISIIRRLLLFERSVFLQLYSQNIYFDYRAL
jgi:hypothetical protein